MKRYSINCCFAVKAPTGLSWPGILADYQGRIDYYKNFLEEHFSREYYFNYTSLTAHASDDDLKKLDNAEGCLIFLLAHGTGLAQRAVPMLKHALIIDDPFCGSGDLIRVTGMIYDKNYPSDTIGTEDLNALTHKIGVYLCIPKIKDSKILVFKNFEKMSPEKEAELERSIGTGSTMKRYRAGKAGFDESVKKIEDTFGIKVEMKTLKDLKSYQAKSNESEAKRIAERWIKNAERVVEPTKREIIASAKMYLALEQAKKDSGADVGFIRKSVGQEVNREIF